MIIKTGPWSPFYVRHLGKIIPKTIEVHKMVTNLSWKEQDMIFFQESSTKVKHMNLSISLPFFSRYHHFFLLTLLLWFFFAHLCCLLVFRLWQPTQKEGCHDRHASHQREWNDRMEFTKPFGDPWSKHGTNTTANLHEAKTFRSK